MPNFTKDDTYKVIASSGLTGDRDDITRTTPAPTPKPSGGTTSTPKSGSTTSTPATPTKTTTPSYNSSGGRAWTPTPTYTPTGGLTGDRQDVTRTTPAKGAPPQPAYNPLSSANTGLAVNAPSRSYGPPAPSQDPFMQALNKWQSAQPAPAQQWQPYQVNNTLPTVGLSMPRPDTGPGQMMPTQPIQSTVTSQVQPVTPRPFYDRAQDGLVQERANPWVPPVNNILGGWNQAAQAIGPVNQGPTQTGGLVDYTPETQAMLERAVNAPAPADYGVSQWLGNAWDYVKNGISDTAPDRSASTFGPHMATIKALEPYAAPIQSALANTWENSAAKERFDYTVNQRKQEANQKDYGISAFLSGLYTDQQAMSEAGAQNRAALSNAYDAYRNGKLSLGEAIMDVWHNMNTYNGQTTIGDTSRYLNAANDTLANVFSGIQAGSDLAYNTPYLPSGLPVSAYIAPAIDEGIRNWQALVGPGDVAWFGDWYKRYAARIEDYKQAVQPTTQQLTTLKPGELQMQQGRAFLNTLGGLESLSKTFDDLVDRVPKANDLYTKAKESWLAGANIADETTRQKYWEQAAQYGAEATKLLNTHPQEIVNQDTNIVRQMATELVLPDVTDLLGYLWHITDLTPKARRLSKAVDQAMKPEEKAVKALAEMALLPENTAMAMAERSNYNKFLNLWTTGTSRAEQATDKMFRYTANLLRDVETPSDARVLLQQLAKDPAKLLTGIPSNLFQSTGILARAGEDGLVKFGSMGLENIKEPLRIYQQAAKDFLKESKALAKGPLLNKVDFMAEFSDAMNTAGYKFFNVEGGGSSAIAKVNQFRRNIVSVPYIFLSPGTWATNILGGMTMATGDGVFTLRSGAAIDEHINKLFGVDPTMRGFEGAASGQSFINNVAPGGIFSKLKETYGKIDEWTGKKVFYAAVTDGMRKAGIPLVESQLTPILNNLGITGKEATKISRQVFEAGFRGDSMLDELNKLISGNVRQFALSEVNPQWLDAVPAKRQEELYTILRTAKTPEEAIGKVREWADTISGYWDEVIAGATPSAQRHVWQAKEYTQDTADLDKIGRGATKYGNVPETETSAWVKQTGEEFKATKQRLDTLMQVVADSKNPNNRYLLYNVWGQVTDSTSKVRDELMQAAERIKNLPAEERAAAWANEYWPQAKQLWAERNAAVNQLLEQGAQAVASGADFTPSMDTWNILERTARKNEAKLWETLRLEPQSGMADARLQQVMQAGRDLVDKSMARVYSAARRFVNVDAMDHIISAEHDVQIAGGAARNYLDKVLDSTLKAKNPNWENYFSIRNETWRQLRQYEVNRWGLAEKSIVRDGLGLEKASGLRFDAGPDGMVELLDKEARTVRKTDKTLTREKVTAEEKEYWSVKREDGTITRVPGSMVPEELKQKFAGLTPDQVDAEVQLELDNIASAEPFAEDAQKILNTPAPAPLPSPQEVIQRQGGKTATEINDARLAENARKRKPIYAGNAMLQFEDAGDELLYLAGGSPSNKNAQRARDTLWKSGDYEKFDDVRKAAGDMRKRANEFKQAARESKDWRGIAQYGPGGADIIEIPSSKAAPKSAPTAPIQAGINEVVGRAQDQVSALEEARNAMRTEWDKIAVAENGLPKLDSVVMQYHRKGVTSVPEFLFEDVYGKTIAGVPINNQADVENFINDYAQLKRQVNVARQQAEANAVTMNDLHNIAQQAGIPTATNKGNPNNQYLLNAINKDRKAAGLRKITLAQLETDPLVREEAANLLMNRIGATSPTMRVDVPEPLPVVPEPVVEPVAPNFNDNLTHAERTIENTTKAGGAQAPALGLGAAHAKTQIKNIVEHIEKNIEEILRPSEKGVRSEGQVMQALDDFRKKFMPQWDNLKYAVSNFGNEMRSFTLIDGANKTRLDELLGLYMPYGFWTTRSMKNSFERMIFEPHIWRRVTQVENDVNQIVDQNGDPQRYKGAVPIPIGNGKVIYLRILPSKYWQAAGLFTQNDYADPESANSALGYAIESMNAANLSPYPDIQLAQKYLEGKGNDIYPVATTSQTRMLADTAIMLTGSQVPAMFFPGYFENAVARTLNNMAVKGQITNDEARQAHDLLWQKKHSGPPLPEQANYDMAKLQGILDTAMKQAAGDDLMAAASSFLTGVNVRPFDTNENTWRQAQADYYGYQYGLENPYGSHLASQTQKEDAALNWSKNAIGKEPNAERPGVTLATDQKRSTKEAINNDLINATEKWLAGQKKIPTNKQINDFKNKYVADKLGTKGDYFGDMITKYLDSKFPSATTFDGQPTYKGYAPEEKRQAARTAAYYVAKDQIKAPEYPGDTASKAAKKKYFDQKKAYDKAIEKRVNELISDPNIQAELAGMPMEEWGPMGSDVPIIRTADTAYGVPVRPTGKTDANGKPIDMVGLTPLAGDPKTAADIIKQEQTKYMGPLEIAAREKNTKYSGYGGGRGGRRGGKRSSRRGGGGGGGYGGRGAYVQPIDPRAMSGNLWTDTNFMYKWKPTNIDLSWLEAGKRIGPDSIKPWKPIKV